MEDGRKCEGGQERHVKNEEMDSEAVLKASRKISAF